jgi:Nucleoside 2-deoxyribosyltransferase.
MKFYIASKLENYEQVQRLANLLKQSGWEHTYDWTVHGSIKSPNLETLKSIGQNEYDGVKNADIVIVLTPQGRGTHVELGIAIALNKIVYICHEDDTYFQCDYNTSAFYWLPNVKHFVGSVEDLAVKLLKPEFLYHGSQYLFDVLIPQQSSDNTDTGSKFAVYACENFNSAIPFALPIRWYPDNPDGKRAFSCHDGKTLIEYGSINPKGFGYVYKVSSEYFEKVDNWQWVSDREVQPIEVTKIHVEDYWHDISFSNEALEINKLLYLEEISQ